MPLYTTTFCDPIYTCLFVNAYIWAFFVRIYMRVCKKTVIYLGTKTPQSRKERKYTWQKTACIWCSRNDCKYTWEKTAHIACHNFETNGRPHKYHYQSCYYLYKRLSVQYSTLNFKKCLYHIDLIPFSCGPGRLGTKFYNRKWSPNFSEKTKTPKPVSDTAQQKRKSISPGGR